MKTFVLFLLSNVAFTATHTNKRKDLIIVLNEIRYNLTFITAKTINIRVNAVDLLCTPDIICKAEKSLSAFKAKDFGLEEKDWKLPKLFRSYMRLQKVHCSNTPPHGKIALHKLLVGISRCVRKEFHNISRDQYN